METFKGKAIYNPSGRAGEYSYWACNFYVGCSNRCAYCFLRKGIGKATLGGDAPTLKKSFKDEEHPLDVFEKELKQNLSELQKHGLFFSFTTDPMLPEIYELTAEAVVLCIENNVKVKILTKCVKRIVEFLSKVYEGADCYEMSIKLEEYIAFGFTLTGHDELEPNANTNAERIEAMRELHEAGFKTWASIEPVIDFETSRIMIKKCHKYHCCDLFKVGLERGEKYDQKNLKLFIDLVLIENEAMKAKIYFKDSLLKAAGIRREDLPSNCVTRDYMIFNDK
jgi:DNA repair photolyase